MFRGKKSSNRIELSRLVQDLLNFGVLGSLRLWGWGGGWMGVVGGWGGGWMWVVGGCPHTRAHARAHTHAHTRTCMRGKHNFMQMAAPTGGIAGNSLWCHTCVRMRVHVWGCTHSPPHTPIHPPPHPPGGDPQNQSKFNSTWDISIPFEDLKSVETSPPMGGCIVWWVGGWVGWWVGSGQNTKNLKIVDWIKIIQLCSKIYDLLRHSYPWVGVGVWVDGWVNGWGQVKWLTIE